MSGCFYYEFSSSVPCLEFPNYSSNLGSKKEVKSFTRVFMCRRILFSKCNSVFSLDRIIIYWNKLYHLCNLVGLPVCLCFWNDIGPIVLPSERGLKEPSNCFLVGGRGGGTPIQKGRGALRLGVK